MRTSEPVRGPICSCQSRSIACLSSNSLSRDRTADLALLHRTGVQISAVKAETQRLHSALLALTAGVVRYKQGEAEGLGQGLRDLVSAQVVRGSADRRNVDPDPFGSHDDIQRRRSMLYDFFLHLNPT